jgi:hypothetical protein
MKFSSIRTAFWWVVILVTGFACVIVLADVIP